MGLANFALNAKMVPIYIPTHDGQMTILDGFNEIVTLIPRSEILTRVETKCLVMVTEEKILK